jgi:Ser/Thr protein kinase RdoA (MazF antagonist)
VDADRFHRAATAREEIQFALRLKAFSETLTNAHLPERVTHNDTKINNILFDAATGEGVCVIDLDTVMPGLALHDFGDLVRSATNPAREDEPDLARVEMRFSLFEALLRGYLSGTDGMLTAAELAFLPVAGQVIAFELGLRFLTDFLEGDNYFKVCRENQNLDRCRVQFRLFESMRQQEPAMRRLVESVCAAG